MAAFSEDNLIKKLTDLNNSQQSIQTLSLWLIHHRKHANVITDIWVKELKKGERYYMLLICMRKIIFAINETREL